MCIKNIHIFCVQENGSLSLFSRTQLILQEPGRAAEDVSLHSNSSPRPGPEMRAVSARVYLKSCLDILQGAEDSGGSQDTRLFVCCSEDRLKQKWCSYL